jgi:RNA polymerase sigma-70 factor (ECF subfamily)
MKTPVEPKAPFDQDFAEIYKLHYRRVFSLCRYLLNSFDAAEDATHEVFLKAKRKLATYDPSLPFSSWLSGIASNHCIDLLRRRTTEKRIFEIDDGDTDAPSGGRTPLGELMAAERGHDVRNALSQLPEKYRVPLVLA